MKKIVRQLVFATDLGNAIEAGQPPMKSLAFIDKYI